MRSRASRISQSSASNAGWVFSRARWSGSTRDTPIVTRSAIRVPWRPSFSITLWRRCFRLIRGAEVDPMLGGVSVEFEEHVGVVKILATAVACPPPRLGSN